MSARNNILVRFLDLKAITDRHQRDIVQALQRVSNSGWFLRGQETSRFEKEYSRYIGVSHCVGCGNGLDALTLIFRAYIEMGLMKEGDEVIVPANTYIASILAVIRCHLKPVLVEPDIQTLQIDGRKIEDAITARTRAVMIVHLYGRCAFSDDIVDICTRRHLRLVEDNAQAHGCMYIRTGSKYDKRRTGSFGDAAHSVYPTKNLGAQGDAGAVTTNDEELARLVRALGNYGSEKKYIFNYTGINSRMDELQAAVLSAKLPYLDEENAIRIKHAQLYFQQMDNASVSLPSRDYIRNNVFHIFPVLCEKRDDLRRWLLEQGIETDIHYPIPPHRQKCLPQFNDCKLPVTEYIHQHILSLPVNPSLNDEHIMKVVSAINSFQ